MEALVIALITSIVVSAVETISIIHLKCSDNEDKKRDSGERELEEFKNSINRQIEKIQRESNNIIIENELKELSQKIEELSGSQPSANNNSQIVEALVRINEKCKELEKNMKQNSTAPSDSHDTVNRLNELEKQIRNLEGRANGNESRKLAEKIVEIERQIKNPEGRANGNESRKLAEKIVELERQIKNLEGGANENEIRKLAEKIIELERKLDDVKEKPERIKPPIAEDSTGKPEPKPDPKPESPKKQVKAIVPDKKYIKNLILGAERIKSAYGESKRYGELISDLNNIIENGDFDEPEEIINGVFNTFKRNVYDAMKSIKKEGIPYLEKYLEFAGFQKIDVKAGDDINNSIDYWEETYISRCSAPSEDKKIKLIHNYPYEGYFKCEGQETSVCLRGCCTFYDKGASV